MIDLRTLFIRWYFNEFVDLDPLHIAMSKVSEDSPWHRERTVAVHTNMVVGEYLSRVPDENSVNEWSYADLYGAIAAAFHDVGKPAARKEAWKEDRGTYYRYGGHEIISARLWEDWAVRNWDFLASEFGLSPETIFRIGWMIENHMPWSITKSEKRKYLALGAHRTVGYVENFINFLKADQWGRISDDAPYKKREVDAWCESFTDYFDIEVSKEVYRYKNEDAPILYIPIAASGSGKSTYVETLMERESAYTTDVFSLDALRLLWYVGDKKLPSQEDPYAYAFKKSCDDKHFKSNANAEFLSLVRGGNNVVVDNVNTTRKSRAWYITEARRRGYNIHALLFPIDLQTVLDRQQTRPEKTIPADAVKQQYMRLSYPSIGEVDHIEVIAKNFV